MFRREFAFGHDDLQPVSMTFNDGRNGWGASIVDGMTTMFIMGLDVRCDFSRTIQSTYSDSLLQNTGPIQSSCQLQQSDRFQQISGGWDRQVLEQDGPFASTFLTEFCSVFETTIRYVAGFLSSFELSGSKHQILVEKAKEVADKMAFAWIDVSGKRAASIQFLCSCVNRREIRFRSANWTSPRTNQRSHPYVFLSSLWIVLDGLLLLRIILRKPER